LRAQPLDALAPRLAHPGCAFWAQQPAPQRLLLLWALAAAPPRICLHGLHQQLGLLLLEKHVVLQLLLLLERGQAQLGKAVQGRAGRLPKTLLEPPAL